MTFDSMLHYPNNLFPAAFIPVIFTASLFCLYYIVSNHLRKANSLPYPPGPPSPSLLLGHYGKAPMKRAWFDYMEMGKKYGDVVYFKSLGDNVLVINSAQAAEEILEKQARASSDRPFGNGLDKVVGWDTNIAFAVYSERWRHARRMFHQNFRSQAAAKYHPVQVEKVHDFLRSLLSSPTSEELMNHISTLSQGFMVKFIYGLNVVSKKEDLPQAARDTADHMDKTLLPGAIGYRSIPFIHLLPSLIPNCEFSRVQNQIRETVDMLREGPFDAAVEVWKSGSNPSLVGELMTKMEADGGLTEEIEHIKDVGWTAVVAAADTTTSATGTFFFAMSLHPHVQRKAQEELDKVLGRGRIPQFADRHSLPYIEAIYREVMRWHPALPFGLPHGATEDIIYKGYLIPKGTILHANIWAINHDPSQYINPDKFIPERHLKENGPFENISSMATYGYGRRVCVGRYVADAILWLMMASVLATMNISRAEDAEPVDLDKIEDYYSDYGLCHLHTIPGCKVQPRFPVTEVEVALEHAEGV